MSRLLGYVRVSQVNGRDRLEGRFISPSVQEEAIRGYAAIHGDTIVEVLVELDESGTRADRPLLIDALARIERGEVDGLVVAKLDRCGRSLIMSCGWLFMHQASTRPSAFGSPGPHRFAMTNVTRLEATSVPSRGSRDVRRRVPVVTGSR